MKDPAILYPVFALAAWTGVIVSLIAVVRIRAGFCRQIVPDDFKLGESARVPEYVCIPNRNYMNLLELPLLFYVACILLYSVPSWPSAALALAWLYVVLRVVHSLIHLSYNKVMHRLAAFAASNGVLLGLWICVWLAVADAAAAS